ncbi:unnamed protein product [Xylocopa violacea]|uniref:Ribosomal protein S10 n=1 Tax=Xylocopa violacea TaxID=135666 RepID=A0ABP1NJ71_XYLVO
MRYPTVVNTIKATKKQVFADIGGSSQLEILHGNLVSSPHKEAARKHRKKFYLFVRRLKLINYHPEFLKTIPEPTFYIPKIPFSSNKLHEGKIFHQKIETSQLSPRIPQTYPRTSVVNSKNPFSSYKLHEGKIFYQKIEISQLSPRIP